MLLNFSTLWAEVNVKFETRALHTGIIPTDKTGATMPPIYQTAAFAYTSAAEIEDVFRGKKFGYVYTRITNPTITSFELRMNELENGVGALATSSGMAAIAVVAFTLAEAGSEILASRSLFGGTYHFFSDILESAGIAVRYADFTSVDELENKINDKTRFLFLESISNPKLEIYDVRKISTIARKHHIPLVVDNTIATPYLWCAKDFGADIVIHSATKYITGNGTAVGGILVDTGNYKWENHASPKVKEFIAKAGPFSFLAAARSKVYQNFGFTPSPQNAFLHLVGLETLALRMEKHCKNAQHLAEFFAIHKKVKTVNYPGLKDNPFHETGKNLFGNRYSGILTIELASKEECFRLIDNVRYAKNLANIGDTRTLIIHPDSTIYSNCSEEEKRNAGVTEKLLRISVGIEHFEDILEDFSHAFEKI